MPGSSSSHTIARYWINDEAAFWTEDIHKVKDAHTHHRCRHFFIWQVNVRSVWATLALYVCIKICHVVKHSSQCQV